MWQEGGGREEGDFVFVKRFSRPRAYFLAKTVVLNARKISFVVCNEGSFGKGGVHMVKRVCFVEWA